MTTTDTDLKQLVINKLTQAQYSEATINNNELYFVTDATIGLNDLSSAVQTSLGKADTALQPNDNISELTNNAGYITGITSSDVTTALGYTPYDSSNPNGYTSNVGTITDVQVDGTSVVTGSIASITIDQTYDENSANAQSGVAVAGALNYCVRYKAALNSGSNLNALSMGLFNIDNVSNADFPTNTSGFGTFVQLSGKYKPQLYVAGGAGDCELWYRRYLTSSNTFTTWEKTVKTSDLATKQDTLVSGTNIKTINNQSILGSGNINIENSFLGLGEVIVSSTPLDNSKIHLLNGALLDNTGYSEFITHIATIYNSGDYPDKFTTEAEWQRIAGIADVCDKYVYDSVNNTVRIPKYGNNLQTTQEQVTDNYNVDFVGSNISVNGSEATITATSTTSYVKTKTAIVDTITSANTWKIALQYAWLDVSSQARNVFSAGNPATDSADFQVFQSGFENSALKLFLSSNGNGWDIAGGVDAPSSLNAFSTDEFLYELEFTGTQYIWQMTNLTRGDSTPTVCATINSSSKVATSSANPYYWILGNFQYNFPAYGNKIKYNLANSYYTIDGVTTYLDDNINLISDVYYYLTVKSGIEPLAPDTYTDVQINGSSITTQNGVANILTNSVYNASSNKIATMADTKQAVTALSGTSITLTDNSVNTLTPSGNITFTLPTVTDTTIFHQILVQLNLSTVYTINLGTTTYFDSTAPDLSSVGNYNLIYEYDSSLSAWVVGCIEKG